MKSSLCVVNKKIAGITAIIIIVTTIVMSGNLIVRGSPLKKVALLVGGDETDLGFSMMAIQGAQAISAKYPSFTVTIEKSVPYATQDNVASSYGDAGYDLVFLVGGQFQTVLYTDTIGDQRIPDKYPNTTWVIVPGWGYSDKPNLVALGPSFQVFGHYLAGMLAAKMSKTGAVGFIVGTWYAPSYLCMEGNAFIAGVHAVNPAAVVYTREVGGFNPWGDFAAGKTIAEALIDINNVDIIVHVADYSGQGVITGCAGRDKTVIGCVADQWSLAPDNMLTSVLMDTPKFMVMIVDCILGGAFLGYKSIDVDLSALAPFHNLNASVPQDVKDLLAATEALIRIDVNFDGKIDILDIARAARAFGSSPGNSRWDPMMDFNADNNINILDLARIAKGFGETFTPVPLDNSQPPERSP